jgi:hypothetical protein
MFSEGNAARLVRCDSHLQIVMVVLAHFLKFELAVAGATVRCKIVMAFLAGFKYEKSAPNSHYYPQRAVTSYQITQQNCLQRAGGPKGKSALLRPDFQANTRHRFFFKSQCHHKIP